MSIPTVPGYYWVNIPNEYGWEMIQFFFDIKKLPKCLRWGHEGHCELPVCATEYRGPVESPRS